jgi:hypothetical protein
MGNIESRRKAISELLADGPPDIYTFLKTFEDESDVDTVIAVYQVHTGLMLSLLLRAPG